MSGYSPLRITGMETGLVQEREEFILPDDAYPRLENAFVWRERIKRKKGCELLGRLRRILTNESIGTTDGSGSLTGDLRTTLSLGSNADIEPKGVEIKVGAQTFVDTAGDGILVGGGGGSINYTTMAFSVQTAPVLAATAVTASFSYFPSLPVMGLRSRETNNINVEQTIAFDRKYAYRFSGSGWGEFIPGTTWTGSDSDFFWTTNYWVDATNNKLLWVTNNSGVGGDPIRYTNGTTWNDFSPKLDGSGTTFLTQCLAMVPFRGRLVVFNTLEGAALATSKSYPQRIRWSKIGNPTLADAWVDDIRGSGGFLDVPTAEAIVTIGFVRDNLVVYCERSTWQLRYTGRAVSPFQIEKVNSELGAESTFSAVQFDTSLVGIGDKGIVECDSFQSVRIDINIPDLSFYFNNDNNGPKRIQGVRDFVQRLAYWTFPYKPNSQYSNIFPNRRLVYNYENKSWAVFTDSFTCLGTYQPQSSRTWQNTPIPWKEANFSWVNRPSQILQIIGGNQQGFVEYLDQLTTNDVSLKINNIQGNITTPTVITSVNHNLQNGDIITIKLIPIGTPFSSSLNDINFAVNLLDSDRFTLLKFNYVNNNFTDYQIDPSGTYVGGGMIAVRDNFHITSKKFNFLDEGHNIQIGFIDVLMNDTDSGAISLNLYLDYNDSEPVNTLWQNQDPTTSQPDTFFNSVVPTSSTGGPNSSKNWKRVFCPVRGAFLTLDWTLSPSQMNGIEQESDVQIDAQILWIRKAGRQLPVGI